MNDELALGQRQLYKSVMCSNSDVIFGVPENVQGRGGIKCAGNSRFRAKATVFDF